ncbi:GntR family transcriptional regulator [Pararhizobium sp. YC-54]|uniref:GntR family transcriptional regulator n=1 Tax=Pararhizobium sp. YC-54 TaxID=2986920 RepID=UPI0021F6ECF7|nr:GntR family transcriptional regulator [Pararhizobium sp. YC-54]MCW0000746.1 GntR family transcriptional regulator [Pararhizobium sp. YC-54]
MSENIVQKLRDQIENGIFSGTLPAGKRLDETQLASQFGVSRTPVREALMQLSAIGLIEIRPRRGAIVAEPAPHRVYEMFEVMAELEAMAGAHASRRHTQADRTALLAAHEDCARSAQTADADAYYYANESFHAAIYDASHNGFLQEQCLALHRRLRPYRRLQLRVRNRMENSLAEHDRIVKAILDGSADEAAAALRAHIAVQGDRFSDLIAQIAAGRSGVPA